jgi:hypothetical protein
MTSTTTAPGRAAGASSRDRSSLAIAAVIVAAAIAGAISGGHPTTITVLDAFWCAAFAGGVTAAATWARPWTWTWIAGVAALASVGSPVALVCAVLALVTALTAGTRRRPPAILGAITAALATQALLRLSAFGFFGAPSLVVAAAIAPLLASAYRHGPQRARRRARVGVLVAGGLVMLALVGFGVAALGARPKLEHGVAQARVGLDAARAGDQTASVAALHESSESLDSAHQQLSAPWALPLRAVPVAAQQATALAQAAELGADLADTGTITVSQANYREMRSAKGTIDLNKLAAMQQPIATSADALHDAQRRIDALDTGWLVAPIASPLSSLASDIDREVTEVDLARDTLAVVPGLLGASGTRRYVVLFTNPAESRFAGGFVGAFAELTAENGKVTLDATVSEDKFLDTVEARQRSLVISPDLAQRYRRYDPARYLQNLTVSPDFPTDAGLVREIWPQITGHGVDGVIMADPFALAGFLRLTGPVQVDGLPQPLTADNAVRYLLKDQYLSSDRDVVRKERLGDSARATFEALTSRDLPGPATIGKALGPVLVDGHLQFTVFNDRENALLDRLGTIRRFDPTPGGDYVSLRTANANPNKIDPYLNRRLDYDVSYNPGSGEVAAVATVTVSNTAPSSGLPPYVLGNDLQQPEASNTMYLSLYSPLDLREATVDRTPFAVEPQQEFGGKVYSSLVTVPAGETRSIRFELHGVIATGAAYHLDLLSQPMINVDGVRVQVHTDDPAARIIGADGLIVVSDRASIDAQIISNRRFSVSFAAR